MTRSIVKDSLVKAERRPNFLQHAVEKWLSAFWNPRARIFPNHASRWFKDDYEVPPHNWTQVTLANRSEYVRLITEYLSNVLQLPENEVLLQWGKLSDGNTGDRARLHKYLKRMVGYGVASHNSENGGSRTQWWHIPLLAIASAPAPGFWPFSPEFFEDGAFDILNGMETPASDDIELLNLLVGNSDGTRKGLLPQLLAHQTAPTRSTLSFVTATNAGCEVGVEFDVEGLRTNFKTCKDNQSSQGHDVSGSLYELDVFLRERGGSVEVAADRNVVIFQATK